MGKIQIKFYLKNMDTIKTKVNVSDFCKVDEEGNYHYKMLVDGEERDITFKDDQTFAEVIQAGILDTLERYYEAVMNGGTITNEKVDTTLAFGDIIVPIESVNAVKVRVVRDKECEYSDDNIVTVEEV